MTDYNEFVTLANDLISDAGRAVTLVTETGKGGSKPWASGTSRAQQTTMAVFLPASSGNFGYSLATDDEMSRVSQVLMVSGPTDYGDITSIVDGSVEYSVEWIKKIQPGDTIVLTAVGIKR